MAILGYLVNQDISQFAQLRGGALPIFLVQVLDVQRKGVADDAHLDERAQQDVALLGAQRPSAGCGDQAGDRGSVLVVGVPLLIGHLYEEVIVHPPRQVVQHFVTDAAQYVRGNAAA